MDILKTFFQTALLDPLKVLGNNFLALLPNLLPMALILIGSITLAWVCAQVVERLLRMLRIDTLCHRIGITSALIRGGVKADPSFLTGRIVYWVLLGFGCIAALAVLHLEPVNKFTESLLAYIPHFLTALLIVIAGFFLSNFISQAVLIAAVNAGLPPARLLAACTRWGIQLLAMAMALEQLGIAETIVVVGFGIAFGGIVLSAAIAFGLGAKDLAKDFLEKRLSERAKKESSDDLHHL